MKNIPLIIVDDDGPRAFNFITKALDASSHSFEVTWLRPDPGLGYSYDEPLECEVRIGTIEKLLEEIKKRNKGWRAIWIWDLELIFMGQVKQNISHTHYLLKHNQPIRTAIQELLSANHFITLISSSESTKLVRNDLLKTCADWDNFILEFNEDWISLTSEQTDEWVDTVLTRSVNAFCGGISEIFENEKFRLLFADNKPNVIPHDFPENIADQEDVWKLFAPKLCQVLGIPHKSYLWVDQHLKPYFKGYFEALKSLVGTNAKCCNPKGGRSPILGVLPILMLRAAIQSGKWTFGDLSKLVLDLTDSKFNRIALCSKHQPAHETRAWLIVLADKLFPLLVLNHDQQYKAKFEAFLSYEDQFFMISYEEVWPQLAKKVHSLLPDGGIMYKELRDVMDMMGDCGEKVGRDSKCVINAYIVNDRRTVIEFRITK